MDDLTDVRNALSRRRFLEAAGTAGILGTAGCATGGGTNEDSTSGSQQTTAGESNPTTGGTDGQDTGETPSGNGDDMLTLSDVPNWTVQSKHINNYGLWNVDERSDSVDNFPNLFTDIVSFEDTEVFLGGGQTPHGYQIGQPREDVDGYVEDVRNNIENNGYELEGTKDGFEIYGGTWGSGIDGVEGIPAKWMLGNNTVVGVYSDDDRFNNVDQLAQRTLDTMKGKRKAFLDNQIPAKLAEKAEGYQQSMLVSRDGSGILLTNLTEDGTEKYKINKQGEISPVEQ